MKETTATTTVDWASAFERIEKSLPGAEPWIRELRRGAYARFRAAGFPTSRIEEWRKTDVSAIANGRYAPAHEAPSGPAPDLDRLTFPTGDVPTVVFVDGHRAPMLDRGALPKGVRVRSLAAVLAKEPRALEAHLGRHAVHQGNPFEQLNLALFADGALVEVDGVVEPPVHVAYLSSGRTGVVASPRTLVLVGRGAQANLVESYAGPSGAAYLTNAATEIVVEDGAHLRHARLAAEGDAAAHISTNQMVVGRSATLVTHNLCVGGRLVRNDVNARLDGEGAEAHLDGLFLATGQEHVDNLTRLDHAKPHGSSREVYKGILAGKARGVFDGRIVVREGAQKTDAKQTNKNLLLSREALVDSNPQLEIYADDVKCTHGSTTGQLEDEPLFYLRSRGIDEAAARAILTEAFARDVLDGIRVEPLRRRLAATLVERLHLEAAAGWPT